jgi:hypothetical protein
LAAKAFPSGISQAFYPDNGLTFADRPMEGAAKFWAAIRPAKGKKSLFEDIYPCTAFGRIDEAQIPPDVRELLSGAEIAFASSK